MKARPFRGPELLAGAIVPWSSEHSQHASCSPGPSVTSQYILIFYYFPGGKNDTRVPPAGPVMDGHRKRRGVRPVPPNLLAAN